MDKEGNRFLLIRRSYCFNLMLKGINFSQFLSDYKEWHALVFGVCETMCLGEPRYPKMTKKLMKQIEAESHYYRFGRVVGYISRVVFIAGIVIGTAAGIMAVIFW